MPHSPSLYIYIAILVASMCVAAYGSYCIYDRQKKCANCFAESEADQTAPEGSLVFDIILTATAVAIGLYFAFYITFYVPSPEHGDEDIGSIAQWLAPAEQDDRALSDRARYMKGDLEGNFHRLQNLGKTNWGERL